MATATITSKHQITIPKAVRQQLNLKEGDQVEFDTIDATRVMLIKSHRPNKSDGAAKQFMKSNKVLTVEEIKASAKAAVAKKFSSFDS